jgi:outer membrane protein assembly factor BamD
MEMIKNFASILVFALLLSGCSIFGFGSKVSDKSPEDLMREGLSSFNEGDYTDALESFQKIKDRYPYSKFAIYAELKLADSHFKRDEFDEAMAAYRDFERLHPKNTAIPYVLYQQGMCNFTRMNTIDRDQTYAELALKDFKRLEKQFPHDIYSLKAKRNIRKCLTNLADHELYVGRFYFKSNQYIAALKRFEYLISHYPDLGQYAEAFNYMDICKKKLSEKDLSE